MGTQQSSSPPSGGGGDVVEVLAGLVAADPAVCDRGGLDGLVAGALRVRGWLDAFDTRIAQRARHLAATGLSESPGSVLANRGRRSQRNAEKAADPATVCDQMPAVQDALEQGEVSGEHVDAIANAGPMDVAPTTRSHHHPHPTSRHHPRRGSNDSRVTLPTDQRPTAA